MSFNFNLETIGTIVLTVAGGGWWLRSQFSSLKDSVLYLLDKHEDRDQKRHEENIERFAVLETMIKNGH